MKTLGILVKVRFNDDSVMLGANVTYHNVTEIHYLYPSPLGQHRVAFESDIHSTGVTWELDQIAEFEAFPETELAEAF